jgi:hypothetical protein
MGQLTYREWRVYWDVKAEHPVLYSTFVNYAWESDVATADKLPNEFKGGESPQGIHSVKSWDRSQFLNKPGQAGPKVFVQGAVDAYGYVKHHTDGVVRSEHVRILAVRVVNIPYPVASCEHQEKLQLVNRFIEEGRLQIGHCSCFMGKPERAKLMRDMPLPIDLVPLVSYGELTPDELEDRICSYYEVAHLPLGVGPWLSPWGDGPGLMPDGEDRVTKLEAAS